MSMLAQPAHTCEREKGHGSVLLAMALLEYPDESDRIHRGARLWYRGHVSFTGGRWTVVSDNEDRLYDVKCTGGCNCPDAKNRAPRGRCKHKWAVAFAKRVNTLMTQPARSYVATDQLNGESGIATEMARDVFMFLPYESDKGRIMTMTQLSLGAEISVLEEDL